jgi:hypothetical protein
MEGYVMTAVPHIQQIAPVSQVKQSVLPLPVSPREKKPVSQTARRDWQEALQTPNESLREASVVPAITRRDLPGDSDSEQGNDKQEQKSDGKLTEGVKVRASATEAIDQALDDTLPLNMNRLGSLITAFVVHSVAHGSWAVQIPLSHALLQETVLHMRCEQETLSLRFETSDWRSRETLMLHAPTLLRRLRESLPQLVDVALLTH